MKKESPVLVDDYCRWCGKSSHRTHPGGVVKGGNWRCLEADCGRWQSRNIEEDARGDGA